MSKDFGTWLTLLLSSLLSTKLQRFLMCTAQWDMSKNGTSSYLPIITWKMQCKIWVEEGAVIHEKRNPMWSEIYSPEVHSRSVKTNKHQQFPWPWKFVAFVLVVACYTCTIYRNNWSDTIIFNPSGMQNLPPSLQDVIFLTNVADFNVDLPHII